MATQLQKLQALLQETEAKKQEIEKTVYYDDFLQAFEKLASFIRDTRTQLDSTHASNRDALTRDFAEKSAKLMSDIEDAKNGLNSQLSDFRKFVESDLRTSFRYLKDSIEQIKSLIPEAYNDQQLMDMVSGLTSRLDAIKMPEAFDPASLTAEIESLRKEIKDIKRTGGGRATALQVANLFKYIGKTEAPVGAINGVNTTYTVSSNIWWIAGFTINGEQVAELPNFTYSGNTITFSSAIPADYSSSDFEVKYIGS